MGFYLSNKKEIPDLVISSTAIRAKTTADATISEGKWTCSLELNADINGGDPIFLLNLAKSQDNSYSSICLVGHEPNFSIFIARSTNSSHQSFSKGSMARMDFDVDKWEDITMGLGNLSWLIAPMDIL